MGAAAAVPQAVATVELQLASRLSAEAPLQDLNDVDRRVQLRVEPDGRRQDDAPAPDPGWLKASVVIDGPSALWLERSGPAGAVDAMVLERASAAARAVLDRTRGRASILADDPAFIETVRLSL